MAGESAGGTEITGLAPLIAPKPQATPGAEQIAPGYRPTPYLWAGPVLWVIMRASFVAGPHCRRHDERTDLRRGSG
jgi:hypothetical protein